MQFLGYLETPGSDTPPSLFCQPDIRRVTAGPAVRVSDMFWQVRVGFV